MVFAIPDCDLIAFPIIDILTTFVSLVNFLNPIFPLIFFITFSAINKSVSGIVNVISVEP